MIKTTRERCMALGLTINAATNTRFGRMYEFLVVLRSFTRSVQSHYFVVST